MLRIIQICLLGSFLILFNYDCIAQPVLTHVDNINAAGDATLHWELFNPIGTEELVRYEIKVFDIPGTLLSAAPHIVAPNVDNDPITGWTMPSFLYNANDFAHCLTSVLVTTNDGGITDDFSLASQQLCSIHVGATLGAVAGEIDLVWNSPHAVSGIAAGGPFYLERLNEFTAIWDTIATIPDSPQGASFTDNPGPCASINIYRVRQTASNGVDINVSNVADLVIGNVNGELPVTTFIDVDPLTGLAVVHFSYPALAETLGFIIYKCTGAGSAEVLQIDDPTTTFASIPTSLASSGPESYRVSAFDCINEDGTPNPNAAGDCTTSIFLVASQIPCSDQALLSWNAPFGIEGGVDLFTIQLSILDDLSGLYSPWTTISSSPSDIGTFLHEGIDVFRTYKYRIQGHSTTGNIAHSNAVEITFTYPDAPAPPILRRASVLPNGTVEIFIETDTDATEVSNYQLERWVGVDSIWDPILIPLPSALGFPLTFVDSEVETSVRSYTYRCTVFNSCNAPVAVSNIGKTILLQGWRSTDTQAFENSLIWSKYEDFYEGIDSYQILRAPTRLSADVPLESLASNITNYENYVGDLIDLPGDFCYTVVALENNPIGGLNGASSNKVCLTESPLVWIPTAFTPNEDLINDWFPWNPQEPTLGFVSENLINGDPSYKIMVLSSWGDLIFSSFDPSICWDGEFNNEPIPDGIYSVFISVLDGAGKWHEISQTVQVLRP